MSETSDPTEGLEKRQRRLVREIRRALKRDANRRKRELKELRLKWAKEYAEDYVKRPSEYGDNALSVLVFDSLLWWLGLGGTGPLPPVCLSDWHCKALSAEWFMRQGILPRPEIASFAADVLADARDGGKLTKQGRVLRAPKPRGKDGPRDKGGHYENIRWLIYHLTACLGLKQERAPSVHEELRKETNRGTLKGESACDIAAMVYELSYEHTVDIWKDRSKIAACLPVTPPWGT